MDNTVICSIALVVLPVLQSIPDARRLIYRRVTDTNKKNKGKAEEMIGEIIGKEV